MPVFINIGFGNLVSSSQIVAVVSPDGAPVRRLIQNAREQQKVVDATQGRKTRSVIVTASGHIILSALVCDTIAKRLSAQPGAASAADTLQDRRENIE